MRPRNTARDFDLAAGNWLLAIAVLLLLSIPFSGLFVPSGGAKWLAESRLQMASASILTAVVLFSGIALRGRKLGNKVACVLMAAALVACFPYWLHSPLCAAASALVAGAVGYSICLSCSKKTTLDATPVAAEPAMVKATNGKKVLDPASAEATPKPLVKTGKALIVREPNGPGAEMVFRGTKVPVRAVLARLAEGESFQDVLHEFPMLSEMHLCAAIAFAASSAIESGADETVQETV